MDDHEQYPGLLGGLDTLYPKAHYYIYHQDRCRHCPLTALAPLGRTGQGAFRPQSLKNRYEATSSHHELYSPLCFGC